MKSIYFIADKTDLIRLSQFLHSLSDGIYERDKRKITHSELLSKKTWAIFPNGTHTVEFDLDMTSSAIPFTNCVWIDPPTFSSYEDYLPGSVSCSCEEGNVKSLYTKIVAYIKKTFHPTYNKSYYVGASIYEKWKKHEVSFHFFVDVKLLRVSIIKSELSSFFRFLEQQGYVVEENGRDIRSNGQLNIAANSFIIHAMDANTSSTLRTRRKYYLPESEAVFLRIDERKQHNCEFIADQRHFLNANGGNVAPLFLLICNCASSVSRDCASTAPPK